MTAKWYLRSLARIDRSINEKQLELERLRALAEQVTSDPASGSIRSGKPSDKVGDTVAKIVDLSAEVNESIDELVDRKRKVLHAIDELDDSEKALVEFRYIRNIDWEEIAKIMGCSKRTVHNIHSRALQKIKI